MLASLTFPPSWRLLQGAERQSFLNNEYDDAKDRELVSVVKATSASAKDVFAILEHQPLGYIAHPETSTIDLQSVIKQYKADLEILNGENNLAPSESVRWGRFFVPPTYDAQQHRLDYGIELRFGGNPGVNLYRVKLVRDGALVLTLVGDRPAQVSLEGWTITPEKNLAYENYQAGKDKLAQATLANLILMNRFI